MENKEIYIDGVDVSGCKHFENADQEMCCELTCCGGCRGIDCYYKQLKRKEQECERLTSTLTEIKEIAENLAPMTDEYDNCYYKDRCSKCWVKDGCQYFKVEQILQKISECEGNDVH